MFCNGCGGQLNLAPCPRCEAVNDVTASVCHACKAELVEAHAEHVSTSEHGGSGLDAGGIDTRRERSGAQAVDNGGRFGSRETLAGADDAAGSIVERMAGSTRQARTDVLVGQDDLSSEHATFRVERYDAVPVENAMVALQAAPRLLSPKGALFTRRPIATAAGAVVLVAIGALLYDLSRSPVRSSPAGSAAPVQPVTPSESAAPVESTGSAQDESAAPIRSTEAAEQPAHAERESATATPSTEPTGPAAARGASATAGNPVQPAPRGTRARNSAAGGAAAAVSESAAACTDGVVALGLCASQSAAAQSRARTGSAPDVARRSAKDDATRVCNDAAAALGLCTR